jgi:hypothetical protein
LDVVRTHERSIILAISFAVRNIDYHPLDL